ncbi:MAG: type IV secretory system conjugative DNA transfer family protein [Eubacteriales bacterium]
MSAWGWIPTSTADPECAGYRRQRHGQDLGYETHILEANTNYVVTDPKQEVLTATGGWLKQNGYEIRAQSGQPEQSDGYNPSAICGMRRTLSSW